MSEKRVVGILCTFDWFDPAYSLSSVILDQVRALRRSGEQVVIFVLDTFNTPPQSLAVPDGVEIRKVIPHFKLIDYAGREHDPVAKDFFEQVKQIEEALTSHMGDITHCFAHDLIFQGWFLPYAVALHSFAGKTGVKFFHWVHSYPGQRPAGTIAPHTARFTLPANSKLVYLNHHDTIALAEAYSTLPKDVVVAPNTHDPRTAWNLHPLTSQITTDTNLLDADFVSVYPVSTPRMGPGGKQVDIVIKIHAAIKRMGYKTVLVVPNAHANNNEELIGTMRRLATASGLNDKDVVFTSEYDGYTPGVPRTVVRELFQLSDTFIFPSVSEDCSLVLLEAMAAKNLLVLNESWPSMREFGGSDALYFRFGANGYPLNLNCDPERYWHDIATIIVSERGRDRSLSGFRRVLKNHSLDNLYKKYLLPILTL